MSSISANHSTGLISYWKLDETSGTREDIHAANDLTANGTGGVGYAAGKIENAADLEAGDSDYLSITNASQSGLGLTGDISISMWLYAESFSASEIGLLSKSLGTGNQRGYLFAYYDGGTPRFALYGSSAGTDASQGIATVNYNMATATWYHVVMFYDASAGRLYLYVNGSAVGNAAGTLPTSIYNNTADFIIGYSSLLGGYWDGLIDEVGIWNRELTSSDVTDIYNGGTGIPYSAASSTFVPRISFIM